MTSGRLGRFKIAELSPEPGPHCHYYDCIDPKLPSYALVASDGENGYVLEYVGGAISYIMGEYPDPHEEFCGMEAGVWVATVSIEGHWDYWGEYDEEVRVDATRKLTEEEWGLLWGGDRVLDDTGYNLCGHEDGPDEYGLDPKETTYHADNPFWDATDAAHPAWWRAHFYTAELMVQRQWWIDWLRAWEVIGMAVAREASVCRDCNDAGWLNKVGHPSCHCVRGHKRARYEPKL